MPQSARGQAGIKGGKWAQLSAVEQEKYIKMHNGEWVVLPVQACKAAPSLLLFTCDVELCMIVNNCMFCVTYCRGVLYLAGVLVLGCSL